MNPPDTVKVALIGNPNCGKTTLFNQMAGQKRKTGNWAGVTVNETKARLTRQETEFTLVDLPGLYGLALTDASQDELVVKQAIKRGDINVFVNVLNANNLQRGLFLTTEVIELGIPTIIVLNMDDERIASGKQLDIKALEQVTGAPVLCTTATNNQGVTELINAIAKLIKSTQAPKVTTQSLKKFDSPETESEQQAFDARFKYVSKLAEKITLSTQTSTQQHFSKIDHLLTSPITGTLGFLFSMYLMFFFAISVSNVFIDFFDLATGAIFINGFGQLLNAINAPNWLVVILADGVGAGIQTVATFIPVIGFLFLFLTLLEESGYMTRAAFVMNNWLQKIGLSGKAFVPLIVSFGCNVPAVMATRALAKKDERIITTLMAPFMSCGARLSVYALFVAAFFTQHAALIVLSLYLIGVLVAIGTGLLMRKTILPGKPDPLLIELPQWRFPGMTFILKSTWHKLRGFIIDAGKIIIVIVVILQIISSVGRDLSWGNENVDDSLLAAGSQIAAPIFAPMGIEQENWPAVVGLFTGLLAKEVMVGSLDAIYSKSVDSSDATVSEELLAALNSIPDNAAGLADALVDPLGLSLAAVDEVENMAENQGVSSQLFGILQEKFSSAWAAYAYLLFVLLYFPCVTVIATMAKETGKKWAVFSALYSTALAYIVASCFYQAVLFNERPLFAGIWLLSCIAVLLLFYGSLKRHAQQTKNKTIQLNIQ